MKKLLTRLLFQIFEDCSCISNTTREFETFALPTSIKPLELAEDTTTITGAFSTLKVWIERFKRKKAIMILF